MIEFVYKCDVCNKPLKSIVSETPLGTYVTISGLGRTKEWDTSKLFNHLCKECALSIDNDILRLRLKYSSKNSSRSHPKVSLKGVRTSR